MAYTAINVLKNNTSQVVAASQTNSVLTGRGEKDSFAIQAPFMRGICIDVVCSAVTAGAGITLKLQTRYSNTQAWTDSTTASVTTNGTFSLKLLDTISADQAYLPLRSEGRVVVTTGGTGATVTVDAVWVPQLG